MTPLFKVVPYFGSLVAFYCDGNCKKAWGISSRPKHLFSEDPDDYVFLADDALGDAPDNPRSYEGGVGKPQTPEDRLNKWCARECERSNLVDSQALVEIKPWQPIANMPKRRL